jgi:hypothetical protein
MVGPPGLEPGFRSPNQGIAPLMHPYPLYIEIDLVK